MIETVPGSELRPLPSALFPRQENSEDHIVVLAEAYRGGAELPPITIDAHNRVVDGFHRWQARMRVDGPDAPIPCERHRFASDKEVFLAALKENAKHGLRFSPADRAKCRKLAAAMGDGHQRNGEEGEQGEPEAVDQPRAAPRPFAPEERAKLAAAALLRQLADGRLSPHRVALESAFRRLLGAIDDYIARGEEG